LHAGQICRAGPKRAGIVRAGVRGGTPGAARLEYLLPPSSSS
jgi:hypothetical protein